MPAYKKRSSKKAAYASRKACTKKDAAAIVKRALRTNLERKAYQTSSSEITVSTLLQGDGTNWFPLCAPAIGNTVTTRVGNEIRLQKLEMRGSLHNNASIIQLVRMVVFYLKDNVTVSSATDIFQSGNTVAQDFSAFVGIDSIHYPLNTVKLQVLHDSVIQLAPAGAHESVRTFKKSFDLKNKKIKFEGNSTGIDNQEPQLYALWFAAEAGNDTGAGTVVELSHFSRCWYTDA